MKRPHKVSKLTLFSPAKINLCLKVVGKRPDGYHDLETVMQAIDLGDTMTFQLADQDRLTCSDKSLACDQSNFVWQSVELFRQKTAQKFQIQIHIEKRIPMQRGLGGGSSNVATTLYALNQLLAVQIEERQLQQWSGEVSSDAPFFFSKGCAFCTSKGEEVQNQKVEPKEGLYLINPDFGLSTKEVFGAFDSHQLEGSLDEAAAIVQPKMDELKRELQKRFKRVFMTGSGSALVCEGGEPEGIPIRFIERQECWYPTNQDCLAKSALDHS
ncbi:MAG: 4-(cytidine 5'-diphospho)-2-C-methyl-D-erythritol kinase [Chlamydiae bacterium]|nr:4-(cytidine 5'-diphospho)-2-C-methyl-D-erythritol kinase [Chlamydiota bacterium]